MLGGYIMNALMTASAYKNQVFQDIILSASVYMMNVKTNICTLANRTKFATGFQKPFSIIIFAGLVSHTCFAIYTPFESLAVFICQAFILTFFTAVYSILDSVRGQTEVLTTGFTFNCYRIFSVPFMKTLKAAKLLFCASFRRKFFTALFAGFNRCCVLIAVLFSARAGAKALPFVISFKRNFAVRARFVHALIISCLFIKEQAQQQEVRDAGI
jgi:hypothetical protein